MNRQKTFYPKADEIERGWYLVDASGRNLGRLASRVARLLLGKDKPEFTPGVDVGDFVIVVNAGEVEVTGKKLDEKRYYRHSEYPGGLKSLTLRQQLRQRPEYVIEKAVWGMLPKNRLGRKLMKKLKIYPESEHPHSAQQPEELTW
ncbi:MAG: 50S ribosomal protein L13 [Anaerolineales bacterium]|nr:50S ribosomal protein L13 [Anaerolineales bacterium]